MSEVDYDPLAHRFDNPSQESRNCQAANKLSNFTVVCPAATDRMSINLSNLVYAEAECCVLLRRQRKLQCR